MKNIARILIILLLLLTVKGSSEKFMNFDETKCKRKHLATAEPGTCFAPDAYRILRTIKRISEKPDFQEKNTKILSLIEPRTHSIVDTVVRSGSLSVPLRIYYPDKKCETEKYPVIFYIHGGAFMYGSVDDYDMLAKKIAKSTKSIVTSVEYRLAPDHPFPAAIDDAFCALQWVSKHMNSLGGIDKGLFIMGSSAGGNIAAVLTQLSQEQGRTDIAGQILYYPTTTFVDAEFPSRRLFLKDTIRYYFITESILRDAKVNYMGNFADELDPRLSPLEAELSPDLPPTLIFTAQCDPLRDEGNLYAQKLKDMGIEVDSHEYEGMIHGFLGFLHGVECRKKVSQNKQRFRARTSPLTSFIKELILLHLAVINTKHC